MSEPENTGPTEPIERVELETAQARRRRSREELEALAQNFTGAMPAEKPVSRLRVILGLGAGSVLLLVAVIWIMSPRADVARDHPLEADSEVAQLQQRLAAERARARRAQTGGNYLERSAASEAALLKELARSAERLASKATETPPAEARVPARDTAPSSPPPAAAAASSQAAAAPGAAPAPPVATAKPAPESATEVARAAPAEAQSAPRPYCKIYVSELSRSGKLTYEDIVRMKGARKVGLADHVLTPPVNVNGREVVFEVAPNGCVTVARNSAGR